MNKLIIILILLLISLPVMAKNEDNYNKQKTLPPGLQKKYDRTGEIPPGWQKKVVKGEVLDPSIYAVCKHYPVNPVDYHLKHINGTSLLRLEDRIIRIINDTKVVLEVFAINTD